MIGSKDRRRDDCLTLRASVAGRKMEKELFIEKGTLEKKRGGAMSM